ncbi:MAG: glycosyltransferase family 4 protein [Motiliproteus sp.]
MAIQTAELCRLLRLEQIQVELIATNAPYRPAFAARIPGLRAVFRLIPYLFHLHRALPQADVVHLMANSGWSWHLFAAPAIWIAHWHRTPVVLNYRGGGAAAFFDQSWRWIQPSLAKVGACVVPSAFLADVFSERKMPAKIIPNTLDETLFYPATEPTESCDPNENTDAKGPILAITRNLEPIYGIDIALKAMPSILKSYPNARLIIAGSGPEKTNLEQLTNHLKIQDHVEYSGRLGRQQIAELYRQADILLNPSRVDNSPNSIIEALGSGLPVVSSRAGGIPKLVTDRETALLVEVGNEEALSKAVIELLQKPELRQQLRAAGLHFCQRFHWVQVKTKLSDTYHQVLNRP